MEKSLNQKYKESNTTLSYKEWRRREDEKMASFNGSLPSPNLSNNPNFQKTIGEMDAIGGVKKDISKKTTLGIPNSMLVMGTIIILGAVAYKVYTKYKQK
jgi:hypothetical protein